MRVLIFLLVLANLLFYAFSHGLFGDEVNSEAANLQEINPQQVRILSRGEPPAGNAPPTEPAAGTPEPAPEPAPVAARQEQPAVCLQSSALAAAERAALQILVSTKFPTFTLQEIPAPAHSWWVYIPPLADRIKADKKAQELKGLGVADYFIVQEGAQRHAISLGIFSSEKSASEHLAQLRKQGVRSAVMSARPDKNDTPRVRLRGPAEQLPELRSALAALIAPETLPQFQEMDCR